MPKFDDAVVWAFTASGALDPSFGGTGTIARRGSAAGNCFAAAVLVGLGDRIVFGGQTFNAITAYDASLWRVLPTGATDTTFGRGGEMTDDMDRMNGSAAITGLRVVLDPLVSRTKILAVGSSATSADFFLRRYTLDGVPDVTFGADADLSGVPDSWIFKDGLGTYASGNAVAVDANGYPYVAGTSWNPANASFDAIVWRIVPSGNGIGILAAENAVAYGPAMGSFDNGNAIAVTDTGVVLVGSTGMTNNAINSVAVWRLDPSTLAADKSFGTNGLATTVGAAGGADDVAYAVAVDRLGRLVLAGYSSDDTLLKMAVWRLIP